MHIILILIIYKAFQMSQIIINAFCLKSYVVSCYIFCFLDAQASLAPTHVSPSVSW